MVEQSGTVGRLPLPSLTPLPGGLRSDECVHGPRTQRHGPARLLCHCPERHGCPGQPPQVTTLKDARARSPGQKSQPVALNQLVGWHIDSKKARQKPLDMQVGVPVQL